MRVVYLKMLGWLGLLSGALALAMSVRGLMTISSVQKEMFSFAVLGIVITGFVGVACSWIFVCEPIWDWLKESKSAKKGDLQR